MQSKNFQKLHGTVKFTSSKTSNLIWLNTGIIVFSEGYSNHHPKTNRRRRLLPG